MSTARGGKQAVALEIYFGLMALLKRAGVREPGGSVSCRPIASTDVQYLVAAEAYMAPKLEAALSKLLSRQVSFDEKDGVVISAEEAQLIAGYTEVSARR